MRLRTKVFIDHTLGKLLCYSLFPLVRIVGILLRRDHSIRHDNVNSIAVAKYYGMGSIVHSTPMLRALREKYPYAKLIFITRKNNKSLFSHLEHIDEVFFVDDSSLLSLISSNIKLVTQLINNRIDLFFDLELFSAYGALISLLSFSRNRIGFASGLRTDFKTLLYTHLMYFNFQMPVRMCYLQMARIANVSADASLTLVKLKIQQAAKKKAQIKLAEILPNNESVNFLAFNINATEVSLERRWSFENLEIVARYFAEKGYHILFVGSADERSYVQRAVDKLDDISELVHNVAGLFSLAEFLAFLKECSALLTTDSGIMNFAYALDVPTVSLWGPDTPVQYHVNKKNTRAIWQPAYCSPCIYRFSVPPCKGNNVCMDLINPDSVIVALNSLLGNKTKEQVENITPVHLDSQLKPLGFLIK